MAKYVLMEAFASENGRIFNKYSEVWQIKDNSFPGKAYGVFEKGKRVAVISSGVFQDMRKSGRLAQTEDATPTWVSVLPLYLQAIKTGRPGQAGHDAAYQDLVNMAKAADSYNELIKKNKNAQS